MLLCALRSSRAPAALALVLAPACVLAVDGDGVRRVHAQPEEVAAGEAPTDLVAGQDAQGAAVAAASPSAQGDAKPKDDAKPKAGDAAAKAREAAKKAEKRARDLVYAHLELSIAELKTAADQREAEVAVEQAQRKLGEARRAMEHFDAHEAPQKLARGKIDLDRAAHRRELAADELSELEAMYEAEEFAETTKELVLKRGRMDLEFAQRALDLQGKELEALRSVELPKERRELQAKLQEAEHAAEAAQRKLERGRLSAELERTKAKDKVAQLERDIAEGAAGEEDGDGEPAPQASGDGEDEG